MGFLVLPLVVLSFLALGLDLGAPPERQWTARGLISAVELYQHTLSPLLARSGLTCRFQPTCSHYGVAVLKRHGALGGSWRAAWRVLRCAPWTPAGTLDPP
ncbi:MAG: membrane protein insertion efficiency factor YidD [Acidobacteriota bacterium]|nr:membrane protein insertion efficiency factor YidD [Acidobacteriota bacterium]MDH3522083.1 membrane protein insertion efficiency factor YidD [Acidobacteriota bacterium]